MSKERNAEYQRDWYDRNRDKKLAQVKSRRAQLRKEVRNLIRTHRENNPCVDCGESDPIVLDFDHVRDKKFNVGHAVSHGYSLSAVLSEIEKCEMRCANCHRRKTHRERNEKKLKAG